MPRKPSKFYVYLHFHPETKQIVYVGKGTAGRAWQCGTSLNARHGRGNRTEKHQQWIVALLEEGYTPADFVQIVEQGLSPEAALQLEADLTEQHKAEGLFNRDCYGRKSITVLAPEQILLAGSLRSEGYSYSRIALRLEKTTMTIWRALNGRTKSYQQGATNGR